MKDTKKRKAKSKSIIWFNHLGPIICNNFVKGSKLVMKNKNNTMI
jgi:hypothetical protein